MRVLIHIYLLCWLGISLSAQPTSADSLLMEELIVEAGRYVVINTDSSLLLIDRCIELAREKAAPSYESRAEYIKGVALKNQSIYEESEAAYQRCIQLAESIPDSLLIADGYFGMGTLMRHQGAYGESLDYLNQALRIRKENDAQRTELARTYNGIGNVLYTIGKFREAIQYYQQALKIHLLASGRERFVASTRVNIGGIYVELEEPDSALIFLQPALTFYQDNGYPLGVGAVGINLAESYLLQGKVEEAREHAELSLRNFREVKDQAREGMVLNTLATIAEKSGDDRLAIEYAAQSLAIARRIGRPDNIRDQYLAVAEHQARAGAWEEAYRNFRSYTELKDSLFNEIVDARTQEEQQRFEAYVKDQEITELRREQLIQARERNWLIAGLALLGLLCLTIVYVLYSRHRTYQQLRQEQAMTQALLEEKEELLQELKSAQSQLVQNEKMVSLGQLTAGIAHEINNPINFITSNLTALRLDFEEVRQLLESLQQLKNNPQDTARQQELLQLSDQLDSAYLSAEINQLIGGIERGAERTRHIVASLRTFSRNTSEQFLPADLNEGIASTLTLITGNLPQGVSIRTEYGELPPVICQISRLNQVFLNLLTNAVQAIPEEGEVLLQTVAIDEEQVRIVIKDTGIGMDEATVQRIFEPFFTTKEVGKGTGLGLSISYGIISQHEGRIDVKSSPGEGTTFTIDIPVEPQITATNQ